MKLVTVVGARPQFIKAAAVSREIALHPEISEVIVHTGQHFDRNMSDVFFEEMRIPQPQYRLDIHSLGHGAMTGRMLEKIEEVLQAEKPDRVLVYGDTNSTLAGALAATKLHIPVVHVEAGLRSNNMAMPEEINRILTDRISTYLCCPTATAVENLRREGFDAFPSRYINSGDVMFDALEYYRKIAAEGVGILEEIDNAAEPFALCTVHRQENTDAPERLAAIEKALLRIAETMRIVFPVHPRTRKLLGPITQNRRILLLEPVGYLDMIRLLSSSSVVLTDSGGLQKEAAFLRKPCVVLRDETEWMELLDMPSVRLAGAETDTIVRSFDTLSRLTAVEPSSAFGTGNASGQIVSFLKS